MPVSSENSRQRILIVSVNWLGDLIFLTPAIRAIRKAHPNAFIACLAPRRGLDLLAGSPHLDQLIPVEESRGPLGWIRWLALAGRLKRERFDTAFLFHRSMTRALTLWWAGVRRRIGYTSGKRRLFLTDPIPPPPVDSLHKIHHYLKVVEAAGILADGDQYDIHLTQEDRAAARRLLQEWGVAPLDRLVALHAGANWRLKRWPFQNFAKLGDALNKRFKTKVVLVGAEEDVPLAARITSRMRTRPLVATGQTTFRQLGALLSASSLLISNDSGPLHLGLAMGTPVVALFGPTDPKLTGPLSSPKAAVLFGSIGCPVPCRQLQCPVNLCMQQITVDQVLEASARFLS